MRNVVGIPTIQNVYVAQEGEHAVAMRVQGEEIWYDLVSLREKPPHSACSGVIIDEPFELLIEALCAMYAAENKSFMVDVANEGYEI